ncbi:MAG: hypothetical protein ACI9OJ_005214, partial [Myxococcota bacterium]
MTLHYTQLACIVGLSLLVVACSESSDDAISAMSLQPQCSSADECGVGMTCHEGHSVCTVATGPAQTVSLVARPTTGDYVPAHQSGVSVGPSNSDIDVVLPKSVRINGQVRVAGNALDGGIEATILAVATEKTVDGAFRTAHATATSTFEITLQADTNYRFEIWVDGQHWPAFVTEATFPVAQEHTFWLPDPTTYPTITGRIFRTTPGEVPTPLNSLVVTAKSSDGLACASDETSQLGSYMLHCPEPGTYAVRVQRGNESDVLIPSFQVVLDGKSVFRVDEGGLDLPDIVIGEQARELSVSVTVDGGGETLEGVRVVAWARLDDDPRVAAEWKDTTEGAILRQEAITDANGKVAFDVLDANYTLVVTPDPSSPFGSVTLEDWNAKGVPDRAVTLEAKPTLTGQILSYAERPVVEADVEAVRVEVDPATGTTRTSTFRTTTDD